MIRSTSEFYQATQAPYEGEFVKETTTFLCLPFIGRFKMWNRIQASSRTVRHDGGVRSKASVRAVAARPCLAAASMSR